MILQRLAEYYDRLSASSATGGEMARLGFSWQKVSFCVVLEKNGQLNSFQSLLRPAGRRQVPSPMLLPGKTKPSGSGFNPCFLWDQSQYLLGYKADDKDPERTAKAFEAFRHLHLKAEKSIHNQEFSAVCEFLRAWSPERAQARSVELNEITRSVGVFRIVGEQHYIHDAVTAEQMPEQPEANENHTDEHGTCLITGRWTLIARLHEPKIKGVRGAQSAGALLVSFNESAYDSYGKTQSYNSPIGVEVAFKYTNALNHLLERRRVFLGDSTVTFWAEQPHPMEEFVSDLFDEPPDDDNSPEQQERIRQALISHPVARWYRIRRTD
jgi:CRISPR-associated protein Csd1